MLFVLQTDPPSQHREVSAELGCVTPYIVAPGNWSAADLKYHAETVAAALTHNASHNCLAAEVLLLDKDWPQREAFLDALRWGCLADLLMAMLTHTGGTCFSRLPRCCWTRAGLSENCARLAHKPFSCCLT